MTHANTFGFRGSGALNSRSCICLTSTLSDELSPQPHPQALWLPSYHYGHSALFRLPSSSLCYQLSPLY